MVARNYDKNHLLENSRVRDLFRNLLFNPVESCPPSIRRPQRAVAAWFDNATVDGAIISESCYTAADHLNSEWPGESEAATECRGDSVNADERPVDTGASISQDEHLLLY